MANTGATRTVGEQAGLDCFSSRPPRGAALIKRAGSPEAEGEANSIEELLRDLEQQQRGLQQALQTLVAATQKANQKSRHEGRLVLAALFVLCLSLGTFVERWGERKMHQYSAESTSTASGGLLGCRKALTFVEKHPLRAISQDLPLSSI